MKNKSTDLNSLLFLILDIDECTNEPHSCDVHAECNNTLGSYKCTCTSAGFYGNGTHCTGKYILIMKASCSQRQQQRQ